MSNELLIVGIAVFIFALEKISPNIELETSRFWYLRVLVLNGIQASIAISSTFLWDAWLAQIPLFSMRDWPVSAQVIAGYLLITFVYYWWHRARHSVPLLWRFLHQIHHSPVRIEVITSFYKSPLEILLNGILTSVILYVFLGLSPEAVGLCVFVTAIAEFFYHMNLRTPRFIGYFFQRPEMHRIHHQRGLHHYNYSDLPVWDMLFGTYRNPQFADNLTGFPNQSETRVWALMTGTELES